MMCLALVVVHTLIEDDGGKGRLWEQVCYPRAFDFEDLEEDIVIAVAVGCLPDLQGKTELAQTAVDFDLDFEVAENLHFLNIDFILGTRRLTLGVWTIISTNIRLRWRTLRWVATAISILRLNRTAIGRLRRLRHRSLQKRLIVSPGFDELLV